MNAAEQREAAFEVDRFAFDRALGRGGHVELRQFGPRFGLEGPIERDVDAATLSSLHVDSDGEIEVAAFNAF